MRCSHVPFLCKVGHLARNLLENRGGFLSHPIPYVRDFGRSGPPLEEPIHAGARNTPRTRDPRRVITTRRGRRDHLAHRLDLLRTKGLLASMAAILADRNSLSMVIYRRVGSRRYRNNHAFCRMYEIDCRHFGSQSLSRRQRLTRPRQRRIAANSLGESGSTHEA